MKTTEIYMYGIIGIFKLMLLSLASILCAMLLIVTSPLWWIKHLYVKLDIIGDIVEKVVNL